MESRALPTPEAQHSQCAAVSEGSRPSQQGMLSHVFAFLALMPSCLVSLSEIWGRGSSLDSADSCLWGGVSVTVPHSDPVLPASPLPALPFHTLLHLRVDQLQNLWFRACSAVKCPPPPTLLPDPVV